MKRAESIVKRLVLGVFVAAAVVCGGGKHPQMVGCVAPNRPDDVLATKDAKSTKEDVPLRSLWSLWPSNWNTRGAWRDSFRLNFADGWVFPWGSNHLAGVEVISQGAVWPAWNDTNAIARLGVPVSIVPGLTTFGIERHDEAGRDSYEFRWDDAAVGRIAPNAPQYELMTASVELFRNGDWCVTTNGAATHIARVLPFAHDGYGQDAEWVVANFTNATEILQQGYAAWVDAQVGEGLTNGLYKLTVGVAEDPPETTLVTVGDYSVAVTNAGEHVFLLEKGPDYALTVFPPNTNIILSAVDDVPIGISPQINTNRHKLEEEDLCGFVQICGQENPSTRGWIADGGAFGTDYAPGCATGRVWWLPVLCGSPDLSHLYPDGSGVTLEAVLSDFCGGGATFHWAASPGLALATPDARTTGLTATNAPSWTAAHLSVTATFGGDHSLYSYTDGLSYGTNDAPQVHGSVSVPSVLILRDEWMAGSESATARVSFRSDIATNGTLCVWLEGGDRVEVSRTMPAVFDIGGEEAFSCEFTMDGVAQSEAADDVRVCCAFVDETGATNAIASAQTTVVSLKRVTVPSAPSTGLCVLKGADVSVALEVEPNVAVNAEWQTAKRRTRDGYDPWVRRGAGAPNTTLAMDEAGVFALRAVTIGGGGCQSNAVEYVHEADEPFVTKILERQGPCRAGDRNHIGVARTEGLLHLRNTALEHLNLAEYGKLMYLAETNGYSSVARGKWKCNRFVADVAIEAGFYVPVKHIVDKWYKPTAYYPPVANEWASGNANIMGWLHLPHGTGPEPGMLAARPNANGPGHCGFVDYDGWVISARPGGIGRDAQKMLDGTCEYNIPTKEDNNEN